MHDRLLAEMAVNHHRSRQSARDLLEMRRIAALLAAGSDVWLRCSRGTTRDGRRRRDRDRMLSPWTLESIQYIYNSIFNRLIQSTKR